MSDARREQDDEPLTQLDVNIDTKHLDSLEGELSTSPGTTDQVTNTDIRTDVLTKNGSSAGDGPDNEPQTMEPPRKMGAPRLRANTVMGVAPPSSGGKHPPSTSPDGNVVSSGAVPTPLAKVTVEGEDEQTTLVGKLLAEAHLEVRSRLKERAAEKEKEKEGDLYQDETATTVGDAEKLIAAANAAARMKSRGDGDEVDEPTADRLVRDALVEDTTAKRDAIDIDAALARAAELRAEAEARKKRAAKKRTIHGLGEGPLTLPAKQPKHPADNEMPTSVATAESEELAASTRDGGDLVTDPGTAPADGEPETLSVGVPLPAPMRSINTEPETMPVQLPPPSPRGERQMTNPVHGSALLTGPNNAHAGVAQTLLSPSSHGPMPSPMTHGQPSQGGPGPWTQPMPLAPTVRTDHQHQSDPALRATMNSPATNGAFPPAPSPHQLSVTPPGGAPQYHSTPMPVLAPHMGPHSGPAAFARTALSHESVNAVRDDTQKKGGRGGLIMFLLLLAVAGGAGYWKRAMLRDTWERYRHPPPLATTAEPAPSTASSTTAAGSTTAPPVSTDAPVPSASASSSATPIASGSAAPRGSASAAASSSASAKPNGKKPPTTKPNTWKPQPPKPKPKPAPDNGGGYGF